jgi:small-conductance mechanosensitive channel
LHFFDWLRQVSDLAASPAVLVPLFLELVCILAGFLLAWGIRAATRSWTDRLVERVAARYRALRIPADLRGLATFCYAWFVLVFAEQLIAQLGGQYRLIGIAASLTGLWIVIRASALLLRDLLLARAVATIAWVVAALDIIGLLSPTETALSNLAITIGTLRLSVLLVIKAVVILAILLWIARGLARVVDIRLQRLSALSPSVRALTGNLIRIALIRWRC